VLADSVARTKGDTTASIAAKQRALELSRRLVSSYPTYKYRVQYQALQTQLLSDLGKHDESAVALESLIRDNPAWPGRADAMVRLAVDYDSLSKPQEEAAAYERFAAAYPKDPRAADAQYNSGVTYLQAGDTASAIRAYGAFCGRAPARPANGGRAGHTRHAHQGRRQCRGRERGARARLPRFSYHPTTHG